MHRHTIRTILNIRSELFQLENPPAGSITLLEALLDDAYLEEFEVIDGLRQHREQLTFAEWLHYTPDGD